MTNNSHIAIESPWNQNESSVLLASTVILRRNLEKFNFPSKMTSDRRKQVITLGGRELLNHASIPQAKLVKAEDMGFLEKEFLVEHYLTTENYQHTHQGEAFILDEAGEFLISLNVKDHFCFQVLDIKGDIENAWNKIVKIESKLGENLAYSYSSKYGYLTADPSECGTGLIVQMYLQPSGLIHSGQWEEVFNKHADDSLSTSGIQGNSNEMIGDLALIRNNFTLGVNEESILANIRNTVTKLLVEEGSARNKIKNEESAEIKDKVARSFGLLIHSYQIEAVEAMNEVALLKLGAELGWLKGITLGELNRLFFNCRRAHLLKNYPQPIAQEDIPHKRAEYIHQALKNVTLTI